MRPSWLSFCLSLMATLVWVLRYLPSWAYAGLHWTILSTAVSLLLSLGAVLMGIWSMRTDDKPRWACDIGIALGALCLLPSSILLGLLGLAGLMGVR